MSIDGRFLRVEIWDLDSKWICEVLCGGGFRLWDSVSRHFLLSSTTVALRQNAGDRIGTTPGVCTELCVYRCTYIFLYTGKGVAALRNGIIVGAYAGHRDQILVTFSMIMIFRDMFVRATYMKGF